LVDFFQKGNFHFGGFLFWSSQPSLSLAGRIFVKLTKIGENSGFVRQNATSRAQKWVIIAINDHLLFSQASRVGLQCGAFEPMSQNKRS
jgi:hypothetical protein